ncbi:hypothetical protein [Novosphingobium huizhouense]|uniref:hypothetical protein n=1 Tax=Novosphingobium huizhouense TaxID=2866625 RepID=UPI001CD84BCC|nr:hypothetical protein [Novosphingobium huizhouense]
MTLLQLVKLAMMASIFISVFALAMRARTHDLFYLLDNWRLGVGALVAMYVVVPAVAVLLDKAFALHRPVEIALIAIAFSPMPPILPGKQLKAGGRPSYVAGLMMLTTAAAVVVAPLGIALAGRIFGVEAGISPVQIATLVGITVAAPLVLGMVAGKIAGERGHAISSVLGIAGHAVLALSMLAIAIALAPAMWAVIGDGTGLALVALAGAGLGAGYLLGGPDLHDKAALSLAAASRHPGIAVAIATASFPDETLAPAAIALGLIVSTLLGTPYLKVLMRAPHDEPVGPVTR